MYFKKSPFVQVVRVWNKACVFNLHQSGMKISCNFRYPTVAYMIYDVYMSSLKWIPPPPKYIMLFPKGGGVQILMESRSNLHDEYNLSILNLHEHLSNFKQICLNGIKYKWFINHNLRRYRIFFRGRGVRVISMFSRGKGGERGVRDLFSIIVLFWFKKFEFFRGSGPPPPRFAHA